MQSVERAMRLKNLGNDPAFQELIEDVKQEQAAVFLKPTSSDSELAEAHAVIRGIDKLESRIRRATNDLSVAKRKGELE